MQFVCCTVLLLLALGTGFAQSTAGKAGIGELVASVFGQDTSLHNKMATMSTLLFNDLQSPGQRAAQRLQQLATIGATALGASEACAAYTFNPGGEPTNAKWTGPTFTLTQNTGSCIIRPAFRGEGNTRWTRFQTTLACLGPSSQWGWTPLTYEGPSREPSTLAGPSCKYTYRLGSETSIKLTGSATGPSKYNTEKDFYSAAVLNKTLDVSVDHLKLALAKLATDPSATQVTGGLFGTKLWHGAKAWTTLMQDSGSIKQTVSPTTDDNSLNTLATGAHARGLGSRTLFGFMPR